MFLMIVVIAFVDTTVIVSITRYTVIAISIVPIRIVFIVAIICLLSS